MSISWKVFCLNFFLSAKEKRNMKKSIYIIKNNINNKVYIGQSVDPKKRFISHISRATTNADHSAIHDAINKYGKEHFWYEILEENIENYNEKEKYWIKYYNSITPYGYNLTIGGEDPPTFYGEHHFASVISDSDVMLIIKDLQESNLTQKQIADKYKINTQLVTPINNGITHKQDNTTYPIRKNSPYHLSQKDVQNIKWLLKNSKVTFQEIADYYKVNSSTIKHINAGRNYYDISLKYPIRTFRGIKQNKSVETILANRSTLTIDT